MATDLQSIPITELIPQRPPFVMIDRILKCDEKEAITAFTIREGNIFLDNKHRFASIGLIENMTQACAAKIGCETNDGKQVPKIGYVVDISNCMIHRLPNCHDRLITQVSTIENVFNLTIAEVKVTRADEVMAEAHIKLVLSGIESIDEIKAKI